MIMTNKIYKGGYNLTDAIIKQSEKVESSRGKPLDQRQKIGQGPSFQEILDQQRLSFSKHANIRAEQRNIKISTSDMTRLNDACSKVSEKGIRNALVVMNESAFIVNAKNNVVVTVMDKNEMKDNIFTNIEGAIFI